MGNANNDAFVVHAPCIIIYLCRNEHVIEHASLTASLWNNKAIERGRDRDKDKKPFCLLPLCLPAVLWLCSTP